MWGRDVSKFMVSICVYEDTKPFKTQIDSHVFTFTSADIMKIQDAVNEYIESLDNFLSVDL